MWKLIKKLIKILVIAVAALFVVYFWNLDQKLMSWLYMRVNEIFDRKRSTWYSKLWSYTIL